MQKIMALMVISILIFAGAGCKKEENLADNFVSLENESPSTLFNEESNQSSIENVSSLVERGMIGIKVVNAQTKQGIPNAPLVKPNSTIVYKTDNNGYVEIGATINKVYVPKIMSYHASGDIDLTTAVADEILEILLQPEAVNSGDVLEFVSGKITPTDDGSTVVRGLVKRNNIILTHLPIATVNLSGMNITTNEEGRFEIPMLISEGGLRFYFPTLNLNKQFQVDLIKGNIIDLIIEL